ncbi:PPR repeat family protein [Hirsutella rhossiliensis]|uniref:PPR repeat family domain-containing protein n=1 Tax=Hirsutella rhossiliensis TaxID=111463 RepID=A0A9P8MSY4_9HYPO|nr:PPR repeat family domain-containing protein [Hirsutella rhossiliensis]KAH0959651.1 PPR repeat family domain-containing protein [Hirsutella rhossiliensis]
MFHLAWRTRSRCVPAAWGGKASRLRASPRPLSTPSSSPGHPPTTHAFPFPYTDDEPRPRLRGDFVHSNHVRNEMLRHAFRDESRAIREDVKHRLSSPFVPPARDYPLPHATKKSMAQALKLARVHVGFDLMTSRDETCRVPDWADVFETLKRTTPKVGDAPSMAALRIVMPESRDLAVENRKVEFIDAATGLVARLRMAVDRQGPSSFFLRGRASVLARAADELIAACKDIQIFKLGDVAAHDYETKRLWPVIEDAPNGGFVVPADKLDNMWVHREQTRYWITRRYENTPKPMYWTKETFQRYVTTLACGRLRPHMALAYYGEPRKGGRLVDTEGVRIRLILDAFEDPSARDCITPWILKMALAFMSHRAGYRASAERLFAMAEEWGVPMDTEVYNIMLQGYLSNNDVALFFKTLRKMVSRFFQPNARTWLLYLRLVQKDDKRRQIIAAMYELGFFHDPATRRGIADVMAGHDAYLAFKAGTMLEPFMANQASRYGEDWLTPGALNGTLREFFRFWKKGHATIGEFRTMMDEKLPESLELGLDTYNIILEYCAESRDWTTALWAIARMRDRGCEPDHYTYQVLLLLARNSRSPTSFGIILFYAVLARQLRTTARQIADEVLMGKSQVWFWNYVQPRVFSNKMARALEASKLAPTTSPTAGVEWAILSECEDYTPVQSLCGALGTAIRTLDGPVHRQLYNEALHPATIKHPDDYTIRMYDLRRRRAVMLVHLDSRFKRWSMIRPADPESDRAGGAPGAAAASAEDAAETGENGPAEPREDPAEAGEHEAPPAEGDGAAWAGKDDARARLAERRFRPHM